MHQDNPELHIPEIVQIIIGIIIFGGIIYFVASTKSDNYQADPDINSGYCTGRDCF